MEKPNKFISYTLIIVGLLLALSPKLSVLASIAIEVTLGWLLTISAVIQIALLIKSNIRADFVTWAISIMLLLIGLYFLINPLSAAAAMTVLFALLAFISGISSIAQAFILEKSIKTILIINGIIGIGFALMIWLNWPSSGITFMGILLGVQLFISGIARLMYAKYIYS